MTTYPLAPIELFATSSKLWPDGYRTVETFGVDYWKEWRRRYDISTAAPNHVPECDVSCNIAHERLTLERKIVRRLIRTMKAHGWLPTYVRSNDDSDEVRTERETLAAVFSVDEARILFNNGRYNRGVSIVLGNGVDCIADWSEGTNDSDGFGAIVQSVCDWAEERN